MLLKITREELARYHADFFLHASEQYFTCSQTFSHFFRQANGRWQTGQVFVGRLGFLWVTSVAPAT
jgi:hypothetical protein